MILSCLLSFCFLLLFVFCLFSLYFFPFYLFFLLYFPFSILLSFCSFLLFFLFHVLFLCLFIWFFCVIPSCFPFKPANLSVLSAFFLSPDSPFRCFYLIWVLAIFVLLISLSILFYSLPYCCFCFLWATSLITQFYKK